MRQLNLDEPTREAIIRGIEQSGTGVSIGELRVINSLIDRMLTTDGPQLSLEDSQYDQLSKLWSKMQFLTTPEARKLALTVQDAIDSAESTN